MRLWLLWGVPDSSRGRLLTALGIFLLLFGGFFAAGIFTTYREENGWPAALFFCVIVAYLVPVFQFITRRTEDAFDDLLAVLNLDEHTARELRRRIAHRSGVWVLVNLLIGLSAWLGQSYLLSGSFSSMFYALTSTTYGFAMSTGPLLVWVTVTCAVHALIDNARLFRQLAGNVEIDVLNGASLNPFGRMAVSSTLVVVGAQASFPIMWLGPDNNPWTTIPGLVATAVPMVYLLLAPVWPLHRSLREAKAEYLAALQMDINAAQRQAYQTLAPLLAVRREIASIPEWPFDLGIMTRLGLYIFVVPLTWIGAALIEMLVEMFVS